MLLLGRIFLLAVVRMLVYFISMTSVKPASRNEAP
jgi:hypothetical protein